MKLARVFSFPAFLAILLAAAAYFPSSEKLADPDTWWHIAVGERILSTGTWPTADSYSFTVAGHPWIAYEWLGEIVMALAARAGGVRALTALLIALSAMLVLLLYAYVTLHCRNAKAAFVACALALPLTAAFFTLRPQLLGYGCLLVTLICLEHFRRGRTKPVWVLPAMFLVWVNTHGSFALGLIILTLYWLSGLFSFRWGGLVAQPWTAAQRRQLLCVLLLCVLVLPLTPYGTRLAAYPFEMALFQPVNVANIQEWQPLDFANWWGKVFLALLLTLLAAQILFRPSYRLETVALLLMGIIAACLHLRFVLLFVIGSTPLLGALANQWVPPYQVAKDRPIMNVVLIGLILAGLVALFPSQKQLDQKVWETYPRQAVEYLREHPVTGHTLNEYGWGGYLIWQLPRHKVFIDGRADIYEYAGVLADYLHVTRLERDPLFLLRKYDVQACLLQRKAALSTVLAALPDWERVYSDDVSAFFVRKSSGQLARTDLAPIPPANAQPHR